MASRAGALRAATPGWLSRRSTALGRSFFQGQNKLIKLFTALVIKPCWLGGIILGINLLQGERRLHNASCPRRRRRRESVEDSLCSGAGRCSVPASPAGPRPNFSAKGHFPSSRARAAGPERSPQNLWRQNLPAQETENRKSGRVYLDVTLLPKKERKENQTPFHSGVPPRALCRR